MNVEFKVGDKLKYIGCSYEHYTKGAVYEVTGIDEGEDGIWIVINDNEGLYRGWKPVDVAKFFERIDEPRVDRNESQPQVTKVKLTQEQAEAIKRLIEMGWDVEEIINEHHVPRAKELEVLNNLSTADVARALLIGYEVEQTAEEKVLSEVKAAFDDEGYGEVEYTCYTDGVRMVLDAYGITVKGINDND